jgi:transposase
VSVRQLILQIWFQKMAIHLTIPEKVFILKKYYETRNYRQTIASFHLTFGRLISTSAVNRIINNFDNHGSVSRKPGSGRPSKVNDQNNIDIIQEAIITTPSNSTRKLAVQTGFTRNVVHTILRKKLNFFPYKVRRSHELLPGDTARRTHFCEWFMENVAPDDDRIFYTDEAWVLLSTGPNRQNYRLWSPDNPHENFQMPLHSQKLGIWGAISRRRIYIHFFNFTVTAPRYMEIIDDFIDNMSLEERGTCWFQQDGAPAHTANITLNYLEELFQGRVISKGLWPPRSPDFNPCDYFLWGAIKENIFAKKPQTIDELKQHVTEVVDGIQQETLVSVFDNMHKRVHLCHQHGGDLFEQYL